MIDKFQAQREEVIINKDTSLPRLYFTRDFDKNVACIEAVTVGNDVIESLQSEDMLFSLPLNTLEDMAPSVARQTYRQNKSGRNTIAKPFPIDFILEDEHSGGYSTEEEWSPQTTNENGDKQILNHDGKSKGNLPCLEEIYNVPSTTSQRNNKNTKLQLQTKDTSETINAPLKRHSTKTWTYLTQPLFGDGTFKRSTIKPATTQTVTLTDEIGTELTHLKRHRNLKASREKKRNDEHNIAELETQQCRDQFCSTNIQVALHAKVNKDSPLTPSDTNTDDSDSLLDVFSISDLTNSPKPHTLLDTSIRTPDGKNKTVDCERGRNMRTVDKDVGEALSESINEKSVLPILKKELQCKIQYRRMSRGEPELVLEREQPKTFQLTPEEVVKRNTRLEQNRRSAKRSRLIQKKNEEQLLQKVNKEIQRQTKLKKEHEKLWKLRDAMKMKLDQHLITCTKDVSSV